MAYIALYRKWRPKTFTDVVGQKQVSETLMRAIRDKKVAHAYLFAGPRGTGKTSMAKIFARAINCEQGPTDHPCNECAACQQILRGDSMDVIEIDAASNRGIDEIRALRENVKFLPVDMRKKIFIIDEAHMLTNEAWNALLKTIEEPPDHVMFIFATTETDKLPVTIVSRCQRYTFRRISVEDMIEHLLRVARESNIQLDPTAAKVIAVEADGGLRDALSILDQCSGMKDGLILASDVEEMMGLVGRKEVMDVYEAIRNGDGASILQYIKEFLVQGKEATELLRALGEHLRAVLLHKVMPKAEDLLIYEEYKDRLAAESEAVTMAEINNYISKLQQIAAQCKEADNPRLIVEMGLLSLCRSDSDAEGASVQDRLTMIEQGQQRTLEDMQSRIVQVEQRLDDGDFSMPIQDVATSQGEKQRIVVPVTQPTETPKRAPQIQEKPVKRKQGNYTSPEVYFGDDVMDANTYRKLQEEFVRKLFSRDEHMIAACYSQAKLIYVDDSHAVFVFDKDNIIKIVHDEGYRLINTILSGVVGHPVSVQVFSEKDPGARMYDDMAKKCTAAGNFHPQDILGKAKSPTPSAKPIVEKEEPKVVEVAPVEPKAVTAEVTPQVEEIVPMDEGEMDEYEMIPPPMEYEEIPMPEEETFQSASSAPEVSEDANEESTVSLPHPLPGEEHGPSVTLSDDMKLLSEEEKDKMVEGDSLIAKVFDSFPEHLEVVVEEVES